MSASFADGPAGALTGYRAIELAGPLGEWCGRLLANMGADVIKVEPPGGAVTRSWGPFADQPAAPDALPAARQSLLPVEDRSLYFWHNNTSKRGITLDIETEDGRTLLRRLLATADIFLETLPSGAAARLGLDYAALSVDNPGLIVCTITPFGPDGPYAQLHTTDLVSMALGGPMQSCGYDHQEPELAPVRPGPYHSFHTAGHFACTGILAALFDRESSGQGQHIDVAAHDCLAVTVEFANTYWYYNTNVVRRQTGRHATVQPTARTQYQCADGRYVNLGLPREERAWKALLQTLTDKGIDHDLDDPALMDPANRFNAASRAYDLLEVLCATHTADELFHLGQGLGLTWGVVLSPEDWLDDPHAAARGAIVAVDHPEIGRPVSYAGAPFVSPASPWRIRRRAPLLGEDNIEVYETLGLDESERGRLSQRGII
ncbi:MAG: CaiB/BaiF CoA transferase family protein [Dehalococcoidia bacterium]